MLRSVQSRKVDYYHGSMDKLPFQKDNELQVTNSDILQSLNALTKTVYDNDAKIRRILCEHGEKIIKLEEQIRPKSDVDL